MATVQVHLNHADSTPAPEGTFNFGVAGTDGAVDASGNGVAVLSAGTYTATFAVAKASTRFPVYVPDGNGRYSVSELLSPAPPPGIWLQDTFGGTNASGWEQPDIGPAFATTGAGFSEGSGIGSISVSAANQTRTAATISTLAATDLEALLRVGCSRLAAGANLSTWLTMRQVDADNTYAFEVIILTSNAVGVTISKIVGGTLATLSATIFPGITHTAGKRYWIRAQTRGSGPVTLRAKVWADGDPEPAAFQLWANDSTFNDGQSAGAVGIRALVPTGYTGTLPVVYDYDEFYVNAQPVETFTINPFAAPYNAVGDGVANDNTPLQTAMAAVVANGGGILDCRAQTATFKVTRPIAAFDGGGITILGLGAGLTTFAISGAMAADSLFSLAGRHGTVNSERYGPFLFKDFDVSQTGTVKGDAWAAWWQSVDAVWENIRCIGLRGSAFIMVASLRSVIRNVTVTNCGDGPNGAIPVLFIPNLESGVTDGVVEGAIVDGLTVTGSVEHGVFWQEALNCTMRNSTINGSPAGRSAFYGLDLDGCTITTNTVSNGGDDDIALHSTGRSQNNVVTNNVCSTPGGATPGTGYGINEYSANTAQTHTGNTISGNTGTVHRA